MASMRPCNEQHQQTRRRQLLVFYQSANTLSFVMLFLFVLQ